MVDAEIVEWVAQAGPYVSAAIGAYGVSVLTRTEEAAADATVNVGRRILQAVWHRRDETGRQALEQAVTEVAGEPENSDAVAVLRQLLKLTLRDDTQLREELAALLPVSAPGTVTINAMAPRSIAGYAINNAFTGDGHTPRS